MKQQFLFCLLTALLLVPHLSASNLPWAVTATAFKLVDGKDVNNVKLNWCAGGCRHIPCVSQRGAA